MALLGFLNKILHWIFISIISRKIIENKNLWSKATGLNHEIAATRAEHAMNM